MKNFLKILLSSFVLAVFVIGCSELQDDIPNSNDEDLSIVHPQGFGKLGNPNFHSSFILDNNIKLDACKDCHGANFSGGIAKVSCSDSGCHSAQGGPNHPEGFANYGNDNFHSYYIKSINWSIEQCGDCHGNDFSGGVADASCINCHSQEDGPKACNTCHGVFANSDLIAPPQDLSDSTSTTSPGVGAHQAHLNASILSNNISCETCHIVPENYDDPNHIDSDKMAELVFSGLAFADSTQPTPVYNRENATCANIYCHGNFALTTSIGTVSGENKTVVWNKVGEGEAECGTCHALPPQGHFSVGENSCYMCHGSVVNAQNEIIDKDKHINGKADF